MSRKRRMQWLAAAGLVLSGGVAFAQKDIEADPAHHKLLFENDRVKVVRATFEPGEKAAAPFDAKEVVLVRIKGSGAMTVHLADGKVVSGKSLRPGEAAWAPAGRIQPENKTRQRIEMIIVEPKK